MEYYAIICRLCASLDQTGDSWVELFSPKNDQVLPMIRACANIVLCENDKLPQRICERCYQNVELSYNFKMQCEVTDAKLRHEIALLAINSEDSKLPVPPFLVDRNETKGGVTLAVDRVFVKTEVEEDEGEGQVMLAGESDEELCLAKTDLKLEIELDWNTYKNEPSDSEGSDDESGDAVQCEDVKLRHEIALLAKNSEEGKLPVPPFLVDRKETKVDVTLAADKVVIKTEVEEDEDTGQAKLAGESDDEVCLAKMDGELEIELDWNAYKNEPSDSKNEDGLDGDEKPTPNATPPTQQSHICEICGDQFEKRSNLNGHKRTVHGPKRYQCSQCSKCFTKKSRWQDHEVQHTGIRQFECPQCDKKYATQAGLKTHMEDVHTDNLPYVCDKCGKGFASASKLRYHYTVHIETRDVICDICDKGFKSKFHLRIHMDCHLPPGQKRWRKPRNRNKTCVCPFCGKISNSIGVHNTHLRVHTGEKKYECHICFRRFNSQCSQKKHILVHTGEKPYVCQYCQKAFRQKHHMDTHIRGVHTNEKPYKCKFCPRAFATLGNMRGHEKSHGEPIGSSKQQQEMPLAAPLQEMGMMDNMS